MTIRTYLIGMTFSTLICFVAWGTVLLYVEPITSGLTGLLLFFLTLFLGLTGIFTVLGFAVRTFSTRDEHRLFPVVTVSFRQGFLLAVVTIISLILQSQRMLNLMSIIAVVILVSLVEIYLHTRMSQT